MFNTELSWTSWMFFDWFFGVPTDIIGSAGYAVFMENI